MDKRLHILIVDDDLEICQLLREFLEKHSYRVTVCHHGEDMLAVLGKDKLDLILLDIMLPGDDGFSLCRKIREKLTTPIIMLTAMNSEADVVAGLETGADDFVAKPFSPRQLLARIKAVLRRARNAILSDNPSDGKLIPLPRIQFRNWILDQNKRRLQAADGVVVPLSAGEFDLLIAFVNNPHRVLTRDQLLDLTREREAGPFDRTIDVQVGRLRRKIETDPKNPEMIKTVRGGGYQFCVNVDILSD
ncbi:MAG: response regulator transcription factor [Legionellales bacterium]|nr:response regulator transcription factor [Legionellales bacterium]